MHLVLNDSICFGTVGDETIVVDVVSGTSFQLNKIGTRIILGVYKELAISDIIEQLSKDYIEPLDQIAFDVNNFIQKLLDLGIVIDKNESAVRDEKPNN